MYKFSSTLQSPLEYSTQHSLLLFVILRICTNDHILKERRDMLKAEAEKRVEVILLLTSYSLNNLLNTSPSKIPSVTSLMFRWCFLQLSLQDKDHWFPNHTWKTYCIGARLCWNSSFLERGEIPISFLGPPTKNRKSILAEVGNQSSFHVWDRLDIF